MGGEGLSLVFLCYILVVALGFCLAALFIWAAWFFKQWHCLDAILEAACNEDSFWDKGWDMLNTQDVQETKESRFLNDLLQLLRQAAWREKEAVRGKEQVMELLSDLSHQLKTPLANIILDIELLEAGKLRNISINEEKEFLSHAKAQAATMQWQLQCLLKASRLENGIIQFQAGYAGIKPTVAKAVSAVYAQASAKQIELYVEEFENISLYHNPKWTAEAMANVLENAIKYSPIGSQVSVIVSRMDIYTRITFQDQGPGIPETEYNKIFQRFYRGNREEEKEGSGLGLYLAQLIMQSERGYITAESKIGHGSKFHFFLLNKN